MTSCKTSDDHKGDLTSPDLVARHLELIQATVDRMAHNSFILRGWNVTLAAALFALAAQDSKSTLAWIALFPAGAFWALDAYYLWHERAFRKLYDEVRLPRDDSKRRVEPFSLDAARYRTGIRSWLCCLFRPAVAGVHGAVVNAILLTSCFLH